MEQYQYGNFRASKYNKSIFFYVSEAINEVCLVIAISD